MRGPVPRWCAIAGGLLKWSEPLLMITIHLGIQWEVINQFHVT